MRKILYFCLLNDSIGMRASLLTVFSFFFTISVTGQAPFPTTDEIKQFNASTTCVVLEDDPFSTYNIYIKEAVVASWKITPYEFITVRDFNVRRLNPAYSFIVLTQTNFDKDKSHGLYNFINLLQGKNVNLLAEMPEVCAIPLSFAGVNDIEYSYKLGPILSFMQKHAQKISDDPSLTLRKYLKYYNKNIPEIKDKTILAESDDLAPSLSTIDRIHRYYSGKIKIVNTDEMQKAIEDNSANTVILHKVGPRGDRRTGFCFIMLLGLDDSELYYYSLHLVDNANPNGLLPEDLKQLEKKNAAFEK
jgi:hypothetical protein